MGLCPECQKEGETVSYIGASKADIVEGVESQDNGGHDVEENEDQETKICDLCDEEYVVDEESKT